MNEKKVERFARQLKNGDISRREFIKRATAVGLTLSTATILAERSAWAETPRKGGTLRLGMAGGSTTDSMDARTTSDIVGIFNNFTTYNNLVELDADRGAVPELAESWEAKPGATEWVFNIRKGVEFHNGKTMDIEDVLYSLSLHMGDTKSSGKAAMSGVKEIKALGKHQLGVTLKSPNADLPFSFTDYHIPMLPKDFNDWNNTVGTGPYKMERYDPGVRMISQRNPNYWKEGRAHVDTVDVSVIADGSARVNALRTGTVDVINQVDPKTADLLKRQFNVLNTSSGKFFEFIMWTHEGPLADNNLRMAMKHGMDREALLKLLLRGYGSLGNDHVIPEADPFFNSELEQRVYDPDKAKWYLKQAGMDEFSVDITVSTGSFEQSVDMAQLYKEQLKPCNIDLTVNRAPVSGYWGEVWRKKPFCSAWWSGRPTADLMLSVLLLSSSNTNETYFQREDFDKLLIEARGLLDFEKRKEIYWELQRMVRDEGGHLIPVFPHIIDAYSDKVGGVAADHNWGMMGMRLAERAWMAG